MERSRIYSMISIIAGPLAGMILIIFGDLKPGHPAVTRMAGVAIWMAIWWMTEAVPLAVTSLLPVVLFPTLGIMSGKKVAPEYFNHIIFLFIGGFLVAIAMQRWDLHRRIALRTLLICGRKPHMIFLGFMCATAFLSMWISNTATTMMMVPIVMAIIVNLEDQFGSEKVMPFAKGIFLAVAYSASIGGMATLVGTPPNMAFTQILTRQFPAAPEISFASWMAFALPLSVVFLLLVWGILVFLFCSKKSIIEIDDSFIRNKIQEQTPPSFEEKTVLVVFIMLAILWLTRRDIHLGTFLVPGWGGIFPKGYVNDGTAAIALAILLFIIPSRSSKGAHILDWETARELPWDIILLFGGGFALAAGFRASGLSACIGSWLASFMHHPIILVIAIICTIMTFLTEFTSNTATTMMVLPVLAGLSVSLKLNPLLLMIPATLSCSCAFMLPIATPPNAIVFGTHRLKIMDMARTGFWLNLLGVVLITLYTYFIGGRILGIDFSIFPSWAGM